VPETENASIRQVYSKCSSAPRLQDLDEFRADGKASLSFYTYPRFFAEEWKRLVMKEDEERRQRRRNKKKTRTTKEVSDLIVKRYNSEGVLLSSDAKVGNSEPQFQTPGSQSNLQATNAISRIVATKSVSDFITKSSGNLAKVTPPPLPPPAPSPSRPSEIIKSSKDRCPDVGGNQRTSLMNDIVSQQFKLKKVDSLSNESLSRTSNNNEVAAILMRRAALEMSDDESDSDDEDWE